MGLPPHHSVRPFLVALCDLVDAEENIQKPPVLLDRDKTIVRALASIGTISRQQTCAV